MNGARQLSFSSKRKQKALYTISWDSNTAPSFPHKIPAECNELEIFNLRNMKTYK